MFETFGLLANGGGVGATADVERVYGAGGRSVSTAGGAAARRRRRREQKLSGATCQRHGAGRGLLARTCRGAAGKHVGR
ncbi:hypothetical protein EVAR_33403_1 [Eumeta japonica]|uniref:Uncharacterized protein n=1 Tax=Eumeta variegata TaxID=151549 RepID=A0A4C1W0C3_EUMVA|nr:hypothetical protein EVAR_33403_1 [Eumeta japonica]